MITSLNHTGIIVSDLERAVKFYRGVMGLNLDRTVEPEGPGISRLVAYEGVHMKIAFMSMPDGHIVELIQYVHPVGAERPSDERNTVGTTHLGFNVDDAEKEFQRLVSLGARQLSPPVKLPSGLKVCYLQDPDRNWVELVEWPK